MSKLEFKPEDFKDWVQAVYLAKITNARLAEMLKELPKESCKHEPAYTPNETLSLRQDGAFTVDMTSFKCRHCGVKLVARWEVG